MIVTALGGVLEDVLVDEYTKSDVAYHAKLQIRQEERLVLADVRPSDALALALYADVPFFIGENLLG